MNFEQSCFEDILKLTENIEGLISEYEARLLYNTASTLKGDGAIVEIGSWCSKSLTFLAAGALKSKNMCKKYSIDPFITSNGEPNGKYEIFLSNIKTNGLDKHIEHIKEKSADAGKKFNEPIEFLFIDGFHKYDAVKEDFELFYPHIVKNGYVAFHDIAYYEGPTTLVKELSENEATFKVLRFVCGTLLAQKVEKLTPEELENNKKIIADIYEYLKRNNKKLIP